MPWKGNPYYYTVYTVGSSISILVLKDGDVIEQGNREELLAKGGFYAGLYNSQFE